jgi:hypothetical protein
MKKFKEFLKEACWDGYVAKGTKKKKGRSVPNCVRISEEHDKVWKATVKVTKDGKTTSVPVESSDSIRKAVHAKVAELSKDGYKLDSVDYD